MLDEAQLRDWFAAKALPRFISHDRNRRPVSNPEEAATQAYAYADAMMVARIAAPPAPSVADAPAEFTERERFVWNLGYSAGKEETVCGSFEEFFDVSWKRGDCIEDAKPAMRRAWDAATNRAANVAQKCMHGKTYEEHGRTNWNNGIAEAVDAIRALAPEAASSSVADAAVVFYGGQSTAPCVSFDEGAPSVADAKSRSLGKWTITKPKMDGSGGYETYITHYAKEARDAGIAGWGVAEHFELVPPSDADFRKEVAKLIFLLRTTPEKFDDETLMQLDSVEYGLECARNAVADAAGASEDARDAERYRIGRINQWISDVREGWIDAAIKEAKRIRNELAAYSQLESS